MAVAAVSIVAFLQFLLFVTDSVLKYHQKSKLQGTMDSAALIPITNRVQRSPFIQETAISRSIPSKAALIYEA